VDGSDRKLRDISVRSSIDFLCISFKFRTTAKHYANKIGYFWINSGTSRSRFPLNMPTSWLRRRCTETTIKPRRNCGLLVGPEGREKKHQRRRRLLRSQPSPICNFGRFWPGHVQVNSPNLNNYVKVTFASKNARRWPELSSPMKMPRLKTKPPSCFAGYYTILFPV
jgi:hypothetical protein